MAHSVSDLRLCYTKLAHFGSFWTLSSDGDWSVQLDGGGEMMANLGPNILKLKKGPLLCVDHDAMIQTMTSSLM